MNDEEIVEVKFTSEELSQLQAALRLHDDGGRKLVDRGGNYNVFSDAWDKIENACMGMER